MCSSDLTMTGETQAAFETTERGLQQYHARWLALMDLREQIEQLASQRPPAASPAGRELEKLLRGANVERDLQALQHDCGPVLERLEHAQDTAEQAANDLGETLARVREQLESCRAAGLAPAALQAAVEQVTAALAPTRELAQRDPLAATSRLEQLRQQLSDVAVRVQRLHQQRNDLQEARLRLGALRQLIQAHREQGFSFAEAAADPAVPLEEAERQLATAERLLSEGHSELAATAAQQAVASAGRAEELVRTVVDTKARCLLQIETLAPRLQQLRERAATAMQQRAQMEREFPPDAWRAVELNLDQAERLQAAMAGLLDQATAAVQEHQQYFQAAHALHQIERQCGEADLLIGEVGQRLQQLEAERDQCRAQLQQLREAAIRLGDQLRQQTADRPLANQRYQAALQALEELNGLTAAGQADWHDLASRLEFVRADLRTAQGLFQEDLRMAQQAEQEIAEADRELQRARSYNQSGITADTTAAQEQLADARQRLAAHDYEGTIEAANAAERAARMAWGEAERQANEVRRQADWQRRKERVDQVEQWLESTGTAAIRFLQRLQR